MADEYINEFYDQDMHYEYDYVYSINHTPKNDAEFRLHSHNDKYEIVLFLEGDAAFHIEGHIYQYHPHDLYIVRPSEMHHNVFLSTKQYKRIVIFIYPSFFTKNHCEELEQVFTDRKLGQDCQIPARITDQELYHLIMKMNRYIKEGAYSIANNIMIEVLYLLNHIEDPLIEPIVQDSRIQPVLYYINDHLTDPITLDLLSSTFFIDKYYLCRLFKNITGYTINQYITRKRLCLSQEYIKKGQTLLEASANSGFNNYAHFYKTYKKMYGVSPKSLKQ